MPALLTLAIETSNPTAAAAGSGMFIAIGRAHNSGTAAATAELLGEEAVAASIKGRAAGAAAAGAGTAGAAVAGDDDLFPAIDRLLSRYGLKPSDMKGGRVAVSVGPGGYTGLRVACAAAKLIAEGVGARCVAVPTALVALLAARDERAENPASHRAAVALAGKSDTTWLWLEGWPDPARGRIINAADVPALAAEGMRHLIADSHLPASIREACAVHGVSIMPTVLSAAACLHVSATLTDIDPAELAPIYAREPDAVTQWRARHG